MDKVQNLLKKNTALVAIFAIGLIVGIFLRSYQFHDLLRFNADQARDASVVSGFLSGTEGFPLLGPKAGGTDFKLGGMFYHFQIASAFVFGDSPAAMAYPDLLFAIVSIVLLFFLLKKYFTANISLLLTLIFSVSAYAIKYARFAWNPNSAPFWTMLFLYGIHELLIEEGKRKLLWAIVSGIALGVAVQLHTLLLLLLPILLVFSMGYLAVKNRSILKYFFIMIAVGFLLNGGQIYSEVNSGGKNIKAFFKGVDKKEKKGGGFAENLLKNANCSVQSSTYVLTGYNMSDECELAVIKAGNNKLITLFAGIFFVGGLVMLFVNLRKEKNQSKRIFLCVVGGYFLLSFLILIPLANEISMRFYLIEIFLPFIVLGFWFQIILKYIKRYQQIFVLTVVGILIAGNIAFALGNMNELKNETNGYQIVTLGELERISDFMMKNAGEEKKLYVQGNAQLLFKSIKGIQYIVEKSEYTVKELKKDDPNITPVFLIGSTEQKTRILEREKVLDYAVVGRLTVYRLGSKGE